MRTETIAWNTFMSGGHKRPTRTINKQAVYCIGTVTVILLLTVDIAFASPLDVKASALYHDKLLGFGKWAIIIRGGWSTIQKTMQEDFEGAKKSFFSYLMVYVFLLAFPWAMKEMDGIFS